MAKTRRFEEGYTGRKVVDIEVLMNRVLDKCKLTDEIRFQSLKERFQEAVGKQVAPHVNPVSIDKGILSLKVDNSAWKSELYLQKNAIIAKCNSLLGKPCIKGIRFV